MEKLEQLEQTAAGGGGDGGGDCTAGDVNADGTINVLDIVTMVNFVMGTSSPSADEVCAADVNSDGTINVLEIALKNMSKIFTPIRIGKPKGCDSGLCGGNLLNSYDTLHLQA